LLDRLSVNVNDSEQSQLVDYAETFLYQTCNIAPPHDNTGYVYLLVSHVDFDRDYVGQTERSLAVRINEHNSRNGAKETKDIHSIGCGFWLRTSAAWNT